MRALLILAVSLVLALTSASAGATRAERGSLRVVSVQPVVVAGRKFGRYERVRVVARHDGTRAVRNVKANRSGRFRTSFGSAFVVDRCAGGVRIAAVGANGTRAAAKLPELLCPVGL